MRLCCSSEGTIKWMTLTLTLPSAEPNIRIWRWARSALQFVPISYVTQPLFAKISGHYKETASLTCLVFTVTQCSINTEHWFKQWTITFTDITFLSQQTVNQSKASSPAIKRFIVHSWTCCASVGAFLQSHHFPSFSPLLWLLTYFSPVMESNVTSQ